LLLLQTPGLAECEVGRLLKFRYDSGAYQLNLRLRTDIRGFLRSSFFAGSAFLLFFTGFAVGFMILFFIPARTWQAKCNSRAKTCLTCLTQIKPLKGKFAVRFTPTHAGCGIFEISIELFNAYIPAGLAPLLAVKIH
jgi:hypothetical protein